LYIALLGTALASRNLAPFNDPEWEIWSCSPGNMDLPRTDVFFEIHSMELIEREPSYPPFIEWMKKQKRLILQREDERFPTSEAYPLKDMLERFGPYFFTSSIAYMMAMAIAQSPKRIGIWGVDMSASDEYGYQRAGCHYFIQKAREAGIEVGTPMESELAEPLPLYGFKESSRMWRRMYARKQELEAERAKWQAQRDTAASREIQYSGALDDLTWAMNTYSSPPIL
jgi:hypothetical protein